MTEIMMYGIVGDEWDGLDAQTLVPLITAGSDQLDIRINSPGGYIVEGLAIYSALSREAAKGRQVTTHIDGLAASMASVIAMAGSQILMADNALMMIHNPWDIAMGDAAELRAAADKLDLMRDQLVSIYGKQTGIAPADIIAMLNAETWLTSQAALDQKFITSIVGAVEATAKVNVTAFGFHKAPETPRISAMAVLGRPRAVAAAIPPIKEKQMTPEEKAAADAAAVAATAAAASTAAANAVALDVTTASAAAATAATTAERARVTSIRAMGVRHKLEETAVDKMISDAVSIEDARNQTLELLATRGDEKNIGHNRVVVTADEAQKWQDGASAWIMTRAGVAPLVEKAAAMKGEKIKLDPGEFRGVSLVALASESLQRAGIKLPGRDPNGIVGAAFTAKNAITQTTGDFTVLLENTMHKVLQAAYGVTPDTWSLFCGVGSVVDFRDSNRYMLGTFGTLDSLNEAGEFKNKPIPDGAGEKIRATTKGNIINLSRQAIINDDLGAFSNLAVQLGRAAKLTIETDVYAMLNSNPNTRDGYPLFSTQHGNLVSTGGTPPTMAAVDAIRVLMAQQRDVSGNEVLGITPSTWVGPITLGSTIKVTNGAQYDPDVVNKFQRPNVVLGIFETIVDTARLTGPAWYVFADKDTAPAIEVAFLNGNQEPFMDTDLGWRVDGTEWKVRIDYGVGPVNFRSAMKNVGA
ncbi:MAG: ClpP-like prohead protease/major capsid protein fusion protein [Janthinobacterium lividum]